MKPCMICFAAAQAARTGQRNGRARGGPPGHAFLKELSDVELTSTFPY